MYYILCFNDFVERFDICKGITNINTDVEFLSYKTCENLSEITDVYQYSDAMYISILTKIISNGYFYISHMNKFDSEYSDIGKHYYMVNINHSGYVSSTLNYFRGVINNIRRDETIDIIIK